MNNSFEKLTPEQKAQAKNCKSREELLETGKAFLTDDQIEQISGGVNLYEKGDNREDVSEKMISRAFAAGKLTGADFFA